MYIQTYNSIDDNFKVQIDMSRVEALMQKRQGTLIVTGTDTFHVTQEFQEVADAWMKAMTWEENK